MKRILALLFVYVIILSACQPAQSGDQVQLDQPFALAFGQEVVLAEPDLHLRFAEVVSDSRCPTQVNCAWTGEARLVILAWIGAQTPQRLEFNDNPAPQARMDRLPYQDYMVQFQELLPYPENPDPPIPLEDYQVTLVVSLADSATVPINTPPATQASVEKATPLPTPPPVEVTLQLGKPTGTGLRPLLGVNIGPLPAGEGNNPNLTVSYQQIGVNMVRTHDFYGPMDMSVIYPDTNADSKDRNSYRFASSDDVFNAILAGGFEPYLRLGNSYNNSSAPENLDNWAVAAVEVVRYYQNLALQAGIPLRYVEIWNEPDNRQFWDGGSIRFFDLFEKTAKALKAEFPALQIGGPGLAPAGYLAPQGQGFTFEFLAAMQERAVPLDFFSWHMYSNNPDDYRQAAVWYREQLDAHEFAQTQMHVTEWNTQFRDRAQGDDPAVRVGAKAAAFTTASWIAMQESGVDLVTYYRGPDPSMDLPTFYGLFYADVTPKPSALAFSLLSQMVAHPVQLDVTLEGLNSPYLHVLAARNDRGRVVLLLANTGGMTFRWRVDGLAYQSAVIQQIMPPRGNSLQRVNFSEPVGELPAYAVQLIAFTP